MTSLREGFVCWKDEMRWTVVGEPAKHTSYRNWTYKAIKSGPSTEPCGTPEESVHGADVELLHLIWEKQLPCWDSHASTDDVGQEVTVVTWGGSGLSTILINCLLLLGSCSMCRFENSLDPGAGSRWEIEGHLSVLFTFKQREREKERELLTSRWSTEAVFQI